MDERIYADENAPECPLMAKTRSQSHVAGTSAYPPTGDILDKAGNVSS